MIAGRKYIATPQINASSSNITPLLPYCYAIRLSLFLGFVAA